MFLCITCNVFHMPQFCTLFYCLAWFRTVEFNFRPSPKNEMYDDAIFCWSISPSIDYVWSSITDRLSSLLHAHIAYEINTAKIVAAFCRISYFCMIWYGWIHSSAIFNQQDVRWCGFDARFRYQLAMFEMFILIMLSRLLDTHIANEIAI